MCDHIPVTISFNKRQDETSDFLNQNHQQISNYHHNMANILFSDKCARTFLNVCSFMYFLWPESILISTLIPFWFLKLQTWLLRKLIVDIVGFHYKKSPRLILRVYDILSSSYSFTTLCCICVLALFPVSCSRSSYIFKHQIDVFPLFPVIFPAFPCTTESDCRLSTDGRGAILF